MVLEQDIAPSCRFRVYLYGPLDVWKRSEDGAWKLVEKEEWGKGRPARSVFKRLLAAPGRRVSRGVLQDDLWPDVENFELADKNVYNAINQIRGVTGKALVRTMETTYEVADQSVIWVDRDASEALLKEAENRGYTSREALPVLEQALGYLERGELLEGESGTWVYGVRQKSENLLRQCRLWLAENYETQGKSLQAGWQYQELLQAVPPDEEALQRWMSMLCRQGKVQEALKWFQQIKRSVDEQGYTLSPLLDTLARELEQQHRKEVLSMSLSILPVQASRKTLFVLPFTTTSMERPTNLETHLDCATWFGLKHAEMMTLIHQWSGMATFCHALQNQLDQEMKALDLLKARYRSEEFSLSRRSLLIALAALPSALLSTSKQGQKLALFLEELLPQCAASLTACWHLSGGNHLDAITPILDSYLPTLITIVKSTSSYQEVAADLVAQCYFLKTILAWHVEGLHRAETFCIQALYYSKIAKNTNLRLNALNQHALISYYAKQFPKALAKSEEAYSILQQASLDLIFPIMQGRVSMYLAAIQASNHDGHAEQTLEQAKQAFALQATLTEPVPLYADCGDAPLTLWEGLTHYYLSFHDATYAQRALTALRTFGQIQSQTEIPERFRLECLNNRILAAIQCNEMEEALTCWEMGKQGARTLESKQRNREIDFVYQALLRQWPGEMKIQNLIHEQRPLI